MFKLFNDIFRYGSNCKVKVKFKVKYEITLKKCYLHNNHSLEEQSLIRWDVVVYTKINRSVWALIVLSQNQT